MKKIVGSNHQSLRWKFTFVGKGKTGDRREFFFSQISEYYKLKSN